MEGLDMEKLTLAEAKAINATMVTEDHLILHAANVSAAMGALAEHYGADREHWEDLAKKTLPVLKAVFS